MYASFQFAALHCCAVFCCFVIILPRHLFAFHCRIAAVRLNSSITNVEEVSTAVISDFSFSQYIKRNRVHGY